MRALRILRFLWCFVPLFRAFGVPVQVHTTWLLFPCGFVLVAFGQLDGWEGVLMGFLLIGLLLASMLIHEFAHVLAARKYGCRTERVMVIPFGCIADLEAIPLETAEICTAAVGPLASLLLSALAWLAARALDAPYSTTLWHAHMILVGLALFNLGVACFNLLPCFPMDGGRILRSTLAIAIGLLFPGRAESALLLATRITVRYIARPIAGGIILLTIFHTHLWHHLLIFGILMLAGEIEYRLLRETFGCSSMPRELRFLPVTVESFHTWNRSDAFSTLPCAGQKARFRIANDPDHRTHRFPVLERHPDPSHRCRPILLPVNCNQAEA